MSASLVLPQPTERVVPIGLRGGCARPGSGYTFHRVREQTARIAEAFGRGTGPLPRTFVRATPACDAWLVAAARLAPALLPRAFRRLFASVDGERVARFMMDRAGRLESLPVLLASAIGAAEAIVDRITPASAPRVNGSWEPLIESVATHEARVVTATL